ncbi:CD225/dispanin family protein [Millisia brevis]|uniref:CD225/dispanin family protein n=1 Tax=Millisia brevis TaxID=264148 RepID=UPI001FDF8937|nr:CD225/dispanin family protein [Millisia brevis]
MTDPYAQRPGDSSQPSDQSPSFDRPQQSGPNPFDKSPSFEKGASYDQPGSSYGQSSPSYGQSPSFDQGRQFDQGQPYPGSQPYGGSQPYEQNAYGAPQPYAPADPWQQGAAYPAGDPSAAPPKSNVGWAVAAVIFFWPLAFSAFTHALDVFPAWSRGDVAGAQYHSQRARTLGLWALAIWAVIFVLMAIAYIGLIAVAVGAASSTGTW